MISQRYIDEINAIIQRERFDENRPLSDIIEDLETLLEDLRREEEQSDFFEDFNDDDGPEAA